MYFSILSGIGTGIGTESWRVGVAIVCALVTAKAFFNIAIPGGIISGSGPYGLYVQNLRESGDYPDRPWVSYLTQSLLFFVPFGLIALFLTRYFY
jgi:hypothetical protein